MKQKFQIHEISCGSCVPKVKKTLDKLLIQSPKGTTVIKRNEALLMAELQMQFDGLNGYTIKKTNQ